jgi:hypothetical protein
MRRREVLKGLTMAAGAKVITPAWNMLAQQVVREAPLAMAIRGLARKDGTLVQPIQISLRHSGMGTSAITTVNGTEVDRRPVSEGANVYRVFVQPVDRAQDATVVVKVGDHDSSTRVVLEPVRKMRAYILPHSHHDLGYTDLQPKVEERQIHNIELGIDLARKTASYPEGARFVWNLEVLWGADLYMRRKTKAEIDVFVDAVKKGWVSLNGMYGNELTGLCRPEELLQLFRYSEVLRSQCGVSVDSAMLSDVPGFTWGTVTALAQAGIRYFSCGPNPSDRIGRLRVTWDAKPFWLLSPSGKEKVLVWMPWHSYNIPVLNLQMVSDWQQALDKAQSSYDISYMRWSGHGDNGLPDPAICEFVKTWNEDFEWPKFVISSTSEAFSAFDQKHGAEIPQYKGDLTPYWEDGAGSSALETAINRNSADRLTQAETMFAMLSPSGYKAVDFRDAWRNVLLYSEHTWGAGGSVGNPESPMTQGQWKIKRQFALDGESQSRTLLGQALSSNPGAAAKTSIDILNSTSWPRTEVVYLSRELSAIGDHVRDSHGHSVPSQRLASGELAFLATGVPAFGTLRFHLSGEAAHAPQKRVTVNGSMLANGFIRARIDPDTGNVVELNLAGRDGNLIDTSSGESANEYLYVQGKPFDEIRRNGKPRNFNGPDIGSIEKSGPAKVTVEEAGPLVASLRIESTAPGCNSLVRRIRLTAEADWIEISNLVDKKRIAIFSDRADAGPWSQYGGKESVQFAFPLSVPDGTMHMDIPLAVMRPELDQLPGSSKNWLPVGRWIDVSSDHLGVTWASLDAPLVEIGEISATLVGSNSNPQVWREHIAPTQKFYSWVMNNHWETNYRAYQEGFVEFRYALRAHGGYDPAAATRFAVGLSQPLLSAAASRAPAMRRLPEIEPSDVLAVSSKPSEDGRALILQLFAASGQDHMVRLKGVAVEKNNVWLSDLSEKPIKRLGEQFPISGWDLLTVRIEEHGDS